VLAYTFFYCPSEYKNYQELIYTACADGFKNSKIATIDFNLSIIFVSHYIILYNNLTVITMVSKHNMTTF
jgi:hypothetical protein